MKRMNSLAFTTLWPYLSKKDLCATFEVSDRTIRKWRIKLNLEKKPYGSNDLTNLKDRVFIWISNSHLSALPEKYFLYSFDNEQELEDFIHKEGKKYRIYHNTDQGKVIKYLRFKP